MAGEGLIKDKSTRPDKWGIKNVEYVNNVKKT